MKILSTLICMMTSASTINRKQRKEKFNLSSLSNYQGPFGRVLDFLDEKDSRNLAVTNQLFRKQFKFTPLEIYVIEYKTKEPYFKSIPSFTHTVKKIIKVEKDISKKRITVERFDTKADYYKNHEYQTLTIHSYPDPEGNKDGYATSEIRGHTARNLQNPMISYERYIRSAKMIELNKITRRNSF